jgi:hypothetical protein
VILVSDDGGWRDIGGLLVRLHPADGDGGGDVMRCCSSWLPIFLLPQGRHYEFAGH